MLSRLTNIKSPFHRKQDHIKLVSRRKFSPTFKVTPDGLFRVSRLSTKGAVLVEGVVGLMLVIGASIMSVLLLMNTGVAAYNKEKIGFIANSAATYAAATTPNPTTAQVVTFAQNTAAQLGIPSKSISVDCNSYTGYPVSDFASIVPNSALGVSAVSVTIKANLPTLFSAGYSNVISQNIQLTETAVALLPINSVRYLVLNSLGTNPATASATVPIINASGAVPNDGLPVYVLNPLSGPTLMQ